MRCCPKVSVSVLSTERGVLISRNLNRESVQFRTDSYGPLSQRLGLHLGGRVMTMSVQAGRTARSFGADDRPVCPQCGKIMWLTRRGPNGEFDLTHERQTFSCIKCEYEVQRIVDAEGKPSE
jgi:hypothetical protein